jgi:hypothetical protein
MEHTQYPPERLRRLVWAKERARRAQMYYEDIGTALVLDIIDGETTGDHLLDFALVACNGTYDTGVIRLYHELHNVIMGNPHHQVFVVQEAQHWYEYEPCTLRNIFVGELRLSPPEFNIDKQLIGIPVEEGYLVWREIFKDGVITDVTMFVGQDVLYVGPLENDHCRFANGYPTTEGAVMVPTIAPSAVYVHPWDSQHLEGRHGVDQDLYRNLMRSWLIQKTKALSGT